jgi:hypothetical protein
MHAYCTIALSEKFLPIISQFVFFQDEKRSFWSQSRDPSLQLPNAVNNFGRLRTIQHSLSPVCH